MNDITTITNPFGASSTAVAAAPAQSDQERAIAEVQASALMARANPRDERRAMDRIINACARPGLADAAVYSYARGGSDITGPSIRLAEAIAQNWGNLSFGVRELEQSRGMSTLQAYAWDLETNTRREMVFQVPHVRYTRSSGTRKLEDPRDIYEVAANAGARRLRACVLSIVPGDVIEAALQQCEVTMKAVADTSPEAVAKLVDAFSKYGVTREHIEQRIQRRIDAITPAQVVALKKIGVSLRDGMSSPGDWFELDAQIADAQKPQTGSGLKEALRKQAQKTSDADEKPEPQTETAPETTTEQDPPEWPRLIDGVWYDARGIAYNEQFHGFARDANAPAVTEDGKFKRRRGHDPEALAAYEVEQLAKQEQADTGAAQDAPAEQEIEAALDWAASEYSWSGDAQELSGIASTARERAANMHQAAQHKDGALDPDEIARANAMSRRAEVLDHAAKQMMADG